MQASFKPKPFLRSAARNLTMVKFLKSLRFFPLSVERQIVNILVFMKKTNVTYCFALHPFKNVETIFSWWAALGLPQFTELLYHYLYGKFSAILQAYHIRNTRIGPQNSAFLTLLFISNFILLYTNLRTTGSQSRPNKVTYKVTHSSY